MNLRVLTMAIFTNVVCFVHPNSRSRGGDSITGHRLKTRQNEASVERAHEYTNMVHMRNMMTKSDVRFLNSTVVIDNTSGNRDLEIFYEVSHAEGSKMPHKYIRPMKPEEDYSVALKEEIRRVAQRFIYRSNDESLVQGVLNILIEFEDAPHLCHNKTVIVFKKQMREASDELNRIEDEYDELYQKNQLEFDSIGRGGSFSINTKRMISSISRKESPINLNGSNLPPKINLDHAKTVDIDQVQQSILQDQLCEVELKKPYFQEKCNKAMRHYGKARCLLRCKFSVSQSTQEPTLISAVFELRDN